MGGMKSGEENARPHTKLIFWFFLSFYKSDPSLSGVTQWGRPYSYIDSSRASARYGHCSYI
jgi:hypothetical protein